MVLVKGNKRSLGRPLEKVSITSYDTSQTTMGEGGERHLHTCTHAHMHIYTHTYTEIDRQTHKNIQAAVIERGHKMDLKETFAALIVIDALKRLLKIHAARIATD